MYDFKGIEFVDGDLNDKNLPELLVKTQVEKQDGSLQDVKFRIRRHNGEFEGYRVELVKDDVFVNQDGTKESRIVPYFKNDDLNTFLYIEDKQVLQSDLSSSLLKLFKEYDYSKVDNIKDKNNQVFLKEFGEEFWSFNVINDLEIRAKDVDRTFFNAKKDEKLEDVFDRKSEDLIEISEFNYVSQFLNRKEVSKLAHEILGDPRVAAVDINEIEFFKDDKLIAKTYRADAEFDRDEDGYKWENILSYSEKFGRDGVFRKSGLRFEAEELIKKTGSFPYPGMDRVGEDSREEMRDALDYVDHFSKEHSIELPKEVRKKLDKLFDLYNDEVLFNSSLYLKNYEINKNVKDKDGENVFISGVSVRAINKNDNPTINNNYDIFVSVKNGNEVSELVVYKNDIKEPIYFQKDGVVKNNDLDEYDRKSIVRMYQRGQLTDDLGRALRNSDIIRDNEYIRISYPQINEKNIDLGFAALNERGEYEADNRFTEEMKSYMMRGYGSDTVVITVDKGEGLSFEPKDWYKKDAMTDPLVLELVRNSEVINAEEPTRYIDFKLGGNRYCITVKESASDSKNGDKILNSVYAHLCNGYGDLMCQDRIAIKGGDIKNLEFFKKADIGDDFRKTVNELINMSKEEFKKVDRDPNKNLLDIRKVAGADEVEKHANKMGLFYDYIKAVDGVDKLHLSPIYEPTREIFNRANARCESFIKEAKGLNKQVKKSVKKEYGGRD